METLYKTYYKDVLYVCKKLNLNDADANDIAQDSFIEAFSKLNTLNDTKKFKQWICRIANNKALNLLKHNNVLKFDNIDDDTEYTELPDKKKSAETQIIGNEVADILKTIIEKLPLEQRITVFMYYYEDMSVKEIAEAYGISENTVRSRLNYAKKFIKSEVDKLENNGIKLRCTAILPLLYLLFVQEEKAFAAGLSDNAIPSATAIISKVMKNSVAEANANTVTSAAKTGFSLGKIIGISSAAVAVIATAVIGISILGNKDKDDKKPYNDHVSAETTEKNDENTTTSSNNSAENNNTPENNTEENNNYTSGDEYWDFYSVEIPVLPEITYDKIEYLQSNNGPITANIADTIFNFTPDQIADKFKNTSKYSEDSYIFSTETVEECELTEYADVGVQKQFYITDTVKAYPKDTVNDITSNPDYQYYDFYSAYDIRVALERDITNYNNYNKIRVDFNHIDVNRTAQKDIFNILEDIFGKELATYMVYGTDTDGQNNYTKDYINDRDLGDYIKIGESTSYFVSRTINLGKKNTANSGYITFDVYVTHKNEKNQCYYVGDYNSALDSETFLNNFIRGNFGSTDINDLGNFGSEYMKLGLDETYVRTISDGYTYKKMYYPDESYYELLLLDVQKGCKDIVNLMAPELCIDIGIVYKNDKICKLDIEFEGDVGYSSIPDDTEPDYTRLYEPLLGKFEALLGDSVNLSEIDSTAFSTGKGMTFEADYLGKPCKGSIAYAYGKNMAEMMAAKFEINISLIK